MSAPTSTSPAQPQAHAGGPIVRPPSVPAIVTGTVRHVRRRPVHRAFAYRVYQWLVDLDDLPELSGLWSALASFRSSDHLGDPARSIRDNLTTYASTEGVDLAGCRILMLANARSFGYVFDPLTVYWCIRPDGELACVVAEVSNTYGERHCYLLELDENGQARTDKAFYVSPFVTVEGTYDMSFRLDGGDVGVSIVLRQHGELLFTATFRGRAEPATRGALARAAARHPLMPQRVVAAIHWQGIRLWLRRLPIVPRRPHHHQEGVR